MSETIQGKSEYNIGPMLTRDLDDRFVVWFDIDDTLYSAKNGVTQAIGKLARAYFKTLGFDDISASRLHTEYKNTYGLTVRGLVLHHNVDPLDYHAKCVHALPLEDMLQPDPTLHKLLQDIDRSKCQVWGLTNAFQPHAQRVLRILGIEDQIDGLVCCDYASPHLLCKPQPEYFLEALKQAKVTDVSRCLFIDDKRVNAYAAKRLGWGRCAHFHEHAYELVEVIEPKVGDTSAIENGLPVISNLEELRVIWPDIFK